MIQPSVPQKNIIILGAGFGGLAAARSLGRALKRSDALRKAFNIILIDHKETHTYTPGLYEVATATREDVSPIVLKRTAAIAVTESLQRLPIRFLQDKVVAVNPQQLTVTLRDTGTLSAEYLVIALGAVTNDFGIPGVAEYALSLKTFEDALRIRSRMEETLKKDPDAHIVIAGGGATGVELSGELFGMARRVRALKGQIGKPHITLIEAGSRLLPGIADPVAQYAQKRLEHLGVNIMLNCRIVAVHENEATVRMNNTEEHIAFNQFVWSGGIKPPALLEGIVIPKDQRGLCMVGPDLTVQNNHQLYAVGDLTCFGDPEHGRPLPATAYIAIDEGRIAAKNILAHIRREPPSYYRPPKRPPFVIPIGGKWAIAHVGGITFAGFPAFVLRLLVDLNYFRRVLFPRAALRFFVRSTLVYFRND